MSIILPEGPFFVPPYTPEYGGVDFLGLRQVNLDYMSACLPGINNVTRRIRPFSFISWMFWKVHELLKNQNKEKISNTIIENYCEKVETLFTWGHIIRNTPGIPGMLSKPPASKSGKVSLLFKDWKRVKQNTSIMAAVNYGPASKTIAGLSFIDPVERNIYKTCGNGILLAEELDKQLRKRRSYKILDDLLETKGSSDEANDLYEAWNIFNPTKSEKDSFIKSFYNNNEIGKDTLFGQRSLTIELVFTLLKQARGSVEFDKLSKAMAYGFINNRKIALSDYLQTAHYKWLLVQVRQAQRFAFECLFSWIENRIIDYNSRDIASVSQAAIQSIESDNKILPKSKTLGSVIKSIFKNYENINDLLKDANKDEGLCIFNLIDLLAADDTYEITVPLSIRIILLCNYYTELMIKQGILVEELSWGGSERISFTFLKNTINNCKNMNLVEFLIYLFENLVLSQHFAVASGRYDGNTQRLRITFEEEGFESLVGEPWGPGITPDRLFAALSLMNDCGMIKMKMKDNTYFVSL